jgi:Zinc finger, C2H2 type
MSLIHTDQDDMFGSERKSAVSSSPPHPKSMGFTEHALMQVMDYNGIFSPLPTLDQLETVDTKKSPNREKSSPSKSKYKHIKKIKYPDRRFECRFCLFSRPFYSYVLRHVKGVHLRDHQFQCSFQGCGQSFQFRHKLKMHSRVHSGEAPYQCEICNQSFKYSHNLTEHLKIHLETSENKYSCPYSGCSRGCRTTSSLKIHIRKVHTKDYEYQCFQCFQKFMFPHLLRKHEDDADACSKYIKRCRKQKLLRHKLTKTNTNLHSTELVNFDSIWLNTQSNIDEGSTSKRTKKKHYILETQNSL